MKSSDIKKVKVYIGWDSREAEAAEVCRYSILKNSSVPVEVVFLKQQDLRKQGIYARDIDTLASTEFTFTRFLVPHLEDYQGWAIFCDCDFLFLGDVAELIDHADPRYAVHVVQHDYQPKSLVKMDGKIQHHYERKNWSSMILWNCQHPANAVLTADFVNTQTGKTLHRFLWLKDQQIGKLQSEWNWLVGYYQEPHDGKPKALHYTDGGPWFADQDIPQEMGIESWQSVPYADIWQQYREQCFSKEITEIKIQDLTLPDQRIRIHQLLECYLLSGIEKIFDLDDFDLMYEISQMKTKNQPIILVDEDKSLPLPLDYLDSDPLMNAFSRGSNAQLVTWPKAQQLNQPLILRGISKRKQIKWCQENLRDFYYIDTGYFGNLRTKKYHRISKNELQYTGDVVARSSDRFLKTKVKLKPFTSGANILLCPPSQKALKFWEIDLNEWLSDTIRRLKKYTDRPIVVREKQSRSIRQTTDTIEMALADDVYCLVTFNSIAATEALINGKPILTLGPNAADKFARHDLTEIENLIIPDSDELFAWCCDLAYRQFTIEEMADGTAWRILNDY